MDIKAAISAQLDATRLDVLVFGPAIAPPSTDPYVASLQQKRVAIRDALIAAGHNALFGEDVVDPTLPKHLADPLIQELMAMRSADMIVVLVYTPGAVMEATAIAREKQLCAKTIFYCFAEHKDGLVGQHLLFAQTLGAVCQLITLPDVSACHLTTAVITRVEAVRVGKAFVF